MSNDKIITMRGNGKNDEALIATIRQEMEETGLSQTRLAQQIGKSPTALSQFFSGTYPSAKGREEIATLLSQWLESQKAKRRSLSEIPDVPGYTETPSSKRIHAALAYAQMFSDSAVIYGQPGVGKTCTAQEYQRSSPNVWIATMSPATATVAAALEEVCDAVGLRDTLYGAAKMKRAVARRIRGTQGLLIIDEAQHLSLKALEELRTLQEAAGVGLAYMGSEKVQVRITGGSRSEETAQLHSRQGKWAGSLKTTVKDIAALVAAWGISDARVLDAAKEIGSKPGGLRGLTKALRLACMFAAGDGGVMQREHLVQAWRDLQGGEA